jgi:hypothetical protein
MTLLDADESTGHVSTDCWQLSLPVTEGSYFNVHTRPALAQALPYFDMRRVRVSCVCSWAASSRWHGSEEHRVRSEIAQNSKKSKTGTSENWRQALLGMRRVMRTRASCATCGIQRVMRLRGVSSRAMVQAVLTKVSCTASIGI